MAADAQVHAVRTAQATMETAASRTARAAVGAKTGGKTNSAQTVRHFIFQHFY